MKDSELIEEFWISQGGKPHLAADIWFYESDWNMLMPVVDKINKLGYTVTINFQSIRGNCDTSIFSDKMTDQIFNEEKASIEATYKSAVEFIKWYNEEIQKLKKP
jgi:hypothetical protein